MFTNQKVRPSSRRIIAPTLVTGDLSFHPSDSYMKSLSIGRTLELFDTSRLPKKLRRPKLHDKYNDVFFISVESTFPKPRWTT